MQSPLEHLHLLFFNFFFSAVKCFMSCGSFMCLDCAAPQWFECGSAVNSLLSAQLKKCSFVFLDTFRDTDENILLWKLKICEKWNSSDTCWHQVCWIILLTDLWSVRGNHGESDQFSSVGRCDWKSKWVIGRWRTWWFAVCVFICCFWTAVIFCFKVYSEGKMSCFYFIFQSCWLLNDWFFILREIYFSI